MTLASLERVLPQGERMLIDTTAFVAYLDGGEATTPLAAHLIENLIEPGRNPAVLSMVSVTELLVRPFRAGVSAPYSSLRDFLTRFPHMRALPVDLSIAQEAASVRAAFRLTISDSLIVATGIVAQVHHLVTNDADWQRKLQPISSRIRVCLLGQHL
jgi:predicted nucleic acid-binding protein